jgi:hypothetical protein
MTRTRVLLSGLIVAAPLLLLGGCQRDLTQVVLVIQSDLQVPTDVETLDVTSAPGAFSPPASLFPINTETLPPFPLSVGFESGGQTASFSVTARLFRGVSTGNPFLVISRTVTDIHFVPDETMMLVLAMNRECACQGTSCPSPGNPACDNIVHPELQPFDPAVAPPSSIATGHQGSGMTGTGGTGVRPPMQDGL